MLDAYQLTHKAEYLDGAKKTADHLVAIPTPTNLTTDNANHFYTSDIELLVKMAQVTGDTTYSDKATAVMNHFINEPNRYCADGCTTAQVIADHYHSTLGAYPGDAEWEISGWVWAAKLTGQDVLGAALAAIVKADVLGPSYVALTSLDVDKYYSLGLASALKSTALYAVENAEIKTKLLAEQDAATGAIKANTSDGIKQTTAYSVFGLSAAGDSASALLFANYFAGANQNINGGWTESNGMEITEINSEIIGALVSVLPANTFYTIQDAVNAANDGDTINVDAGNYTEQVNITKPLTLTGAGKDTTTITTPEPSAMTIYDAFGSKSSTPRYSAHRGTNIPVVRIAASDVTFQGFDVNLGDKAFWNVQGSYGTNYSRSTGILVDHVEPVPGTADTFTNIKIQNNKVDGMLAGDYGDSIKALGNATVTIQSNTIYAYGESGISALGSEDFPSFLPAYHPTVTANSNIIYGNSAARPGTNYFFGIGYWVGATGSADGNTIYNAPNNNGNALNSWTTMPVSFTHNIITTDGGGVGGNGAQLYQSSNLVFSDNTISNQGLVGITYLNPTITISGNTITNSTDGFLIDQQTSGSVKINNNSISGIPAGHYAITVGGTAGVDSGTIFGTWDGPSNIAVDATNNWWGSPTGPTVASNPTGMGGALSMSTIAYAPWYIDPSRTVLSNNISGTGGVDSTAGDFGVVSATPGSGQADIPAGVTTVTLGDNTVLDLSNATSTITLTPVMIGDNTVNLTQSVVLQSGVDTEPVVLTSSSLGDNISASIPDGTKISGPATWNGTIAPPVSGTPSGDAPAGFSVGGTVISIGSADGTLVFDKPVTLVLAGVTGTVGYRPAGSNEWVQITNTCGTDYNSPTDPTFPGECSISNGHDTKILTYHFTTFGSLTSLTTGGGASGSSGGGGSIAATPATPVAPATPAVPAVSPAVPATPATPATPVAKGKVLGAATYNFAKALAVGSRGADVTALQQYLIDNGFSVPAGATSYYGSQTRAAVIAFQKERGIAQAGNVGPLTRAELNKGSMVSDVAKTNLTADQANSIISLIESFGADSSVVAKVKASLGQ